jgi:hypothetical protein
MVINGVLIEIQLLAWYNPGHVIDTDKPVPMQNQFTYITVYDAETVFNPSFTDDLLLSYIPEYLRAVYEFTDEACAEEFFWELGKKASKLGREQLFAELDAE